MVVAMAVVGLRELAYSSTFQLFGHYIARVETEDRAVALSFDDGPHPRFTPMVLDVLDRYDAKATFFLMGRNLERHPAAARDLIRRGHEIGNHSYSHPKLVFMTPSRVRREIQRTDALIRQLGVTAPIHFRPPHAAKLFVLPYVLTTMDKLSVLGDVDPEEWKGYAASALTASILRQVRRGSIIGLHDTNGIETIRALEQVLDVLTSQGYRVETVSQLMRRAG